MENSAILGGGTYLPRIASSPSLSVLPAIAIFGVRVAAFAGVAAFEAAGWCDVREGAYDYAPSGAGAALPLPYCHIDLADSVADARGVETGSPILPLFGHFVLGLS